MRSLYQSPDHYVPSARAICKYGEKIINREILSPVWRWGYSSWGCIGFEAGAGYCIKPLSLWGTSFVGDLGGFMCCCLCISLGPAVGAMRALAGALKFHYVIVSLLLFYSCLMFSLGDK